MSRKLDGLSSEKNPVFPKWNSLCSDTDFAQWASGGALLATGDESGVVYHPPAHPPPTPQEYLRFFRDLFFSPGLSDMVVNGEHLFL